MALVIHCPDCGGVVGATETTDDGPPCTCFVHDAASSDRPRGVDDTDITDSPQSSSVKTCVKCGKNLTGKKRLKDSHGYWCSECHRADKAEKAPQGVPCPLCHRVVKEETFISIDGQNMCSRCARQKRELKKAGSKKYRAVDGSYFERQNKKSLMAMLGVVIVLILCIVYGMLRT